MKFAIPFIRAKARRRPAKPLEMIGDWTTRDWADLPTFHPRKK